MKKLSNRGFTIIELLIATVIFAVILLVITGAIIQFSRIYYKGTVTSRTQEVARTAINDISQNIQFGSGTVPSITPLPSGDTAFHYITVGTKCYSYQANTQVSTSQHALVVTDGACPVLAAFPANGTELLGENMQLVGLSISTSGSLYTVQVHVVYGDSNDFQDSTKKSCKAIILGGQFCAVAELKTTVVKRIE
jgi:prepilin-type N-terminal cleavage/methylation domain-containing protein